MSIVNQRSDALTVLELTQIQTQNDVALATAINTGASISVNTTTTLGIREDLSTTIIPLMVDICNGIGAIDLSVSFVETNAILTDICSGQDAVLGEIQSGNANLSSINSLTTNVNDILQPKAFSVFGTSSLTQNVPSMPFSGNFVNVPCVWKKVVCETSQANPFASGMGGIGTIFYDTSGTPTGSEPVLLRLNHPAVNQPYSGQAFVGTSFHDITFPDGGLICNHGIGVICNPQGSTFFQNQSIIGYYTT